jgi:DNA polymerase
MDAYTQLLEATIGHLRKLKAEGQRYITVSPETIDLLKKPVARPATRPAAHSQAQQSSIAPSQPSSSALKIPSKPGPVNPIPSGIQSSAALDKSAIIAELRERALVCQKCPNLVASRKNVVFGVGNLDAELMFIGEAPGADEDAQGEPFVGRAGELLTKIIQTMGLSREQVYIANILKCRPDTPGQSYGNRAPTPEEMDRCLPYLHAQIDVIRPKVIVALGGTALDGLFGKTPGMGITRARGNWREYRGTPVMPTYHPSYLLRPNPTNVKRETWEDMLQFMEKLNIPISAKQKAYFLPKPA